MSESPAVEGIAVVGLAGRFPQARTCAEFWANLCAGREAIRFFSDEELAAAGHDVAQFGPHHVRAAAVIDHADLFDAAFFGYSPKEADIMDPQQRLMLETAWEALENAGYDIDRLPGPVGVFAGMANNSYFASSLQTRPDVLQNFDAFSAMLLNEKDYLATRIAYKLNLRGPAVTVQTACSTSLVAVCQACQSLLNYQCDLALAGGVCVEFPQARAYVHQAGGILSADGHCRPFDAAATGTVPGEGVGAVVLRRLEDALADGDQILAVIKGFALNNDGSDKAGFTAPSVHGQAEVIALAQALAGFSPETISYVETHGTATPLGDPIEIRALTEAFRRGTDATGFCGLGGLKSNIGHLDAAAGVAGLIKTVLALRHRRLPPTLHFTRANPEIDFSRSPFFVVDRVTEWRAGATPLRAGVSAFGLGGTNAHVVLEEAPPPSPAEPDRARHLVVLSARTESALEAATDRLVAHLRQSPAAEFADACYTLQLGRRQFNHRRVVVCTDAADACAALAARDPKRVLTCRQEHRNPPLVFMFPGQGAQAIDMGRELYATEPEFRATIDRCAETLQPELGLDLRRVLFPAPDERAAAEQQLRQTRLTQPALFTVEYALARLWSAWGIKPAAMIGHSVGEYVAACLAGVFTLEDALRLVATRARLVQAQPAGVMLAVRLSEEQLAPMLNGELSIAAINSADACVVAGAADAIAAFEHRLEKDGIASRRLRTSHAFHSAMMDPALEPLRERVRQVTLHEPAIPYISNVTGRWITPQDATSPDYWRRHLREPVRFADGVETLLQSAEHVLLEVGPGATLSALARQHPAKSSAQVVLSSLAPARERGELASLLNAAGQLWQAGASLDWRAFHSSGRRRRVALPTYPFERQRHWVEPGRAEKMSGRAIASAAASDSAANSAGSAIPSSPVSVSTPREPASPASRVERLTALLQQTLHELSGVPLDQLAPTATFLELGFDSLFLTQASRAFENKTGARITFRQLADELPTLAELAAYVDASMPAEKTSDAALSTKAPPPAPISSRREPVASSSPGAAAFGPFKPLDRGTHGTLTARQRDHLQELIATYTARTPRSKQLAQLHRARFADPRAATGFKQLWKEMVYPLVARRSAGARMWDIDDNEYVDLTMGFGVNLLGHAPGFITRAIAEQLQQGMQIGPQSELAFEVAALICELTGHERVTFCNTGSEAVMAALRIARTVTGRDVVVYFAGDYHGVFDEALVRPAGNIAGHGLPIAPGIPAGNLGNVLVLEYGAPESLEILRAQADRVAAVLVEPVQSRRPELQPREFLHDLRRRTTDTGAALIFDEIVTGFRIHPAGAQGWFGVQADLATYGKVIGGGLPIGAIAGTRRFMDALDGGEWRYGDDSFPAVGVTFFAGTFIRHPLAMAAARAMLLHLKQAGPTLQQNLNDTAHAFLARLNAWLTEAGAPVALPSCGSMFNLRTAPEQPLAPLLLYHLRARGVSVWENRACFLSTAHTAADLAAIERGFHESVEAMQAAGCFPERPAASASPAAASAPVQSAAATDAVLPLTEAQKEVWLAAQRGDDASRAFNETFSITLRGPLSHADIADALQALVAHHDALRTTFLADGSGQRIARALPLPLPLTEAPALDAAQQSARIAELGERLAGERFDLTRGPLLRAALVRIADEHHVLLLACHHLVCDGWSGGVLLGELRDLCAARIQRQPFALPRALQYADYAAWLASAAQVARRESAQAYWLQELADQPDAIRLPADRAPPAQRTYRGAHVSVVFEREFLAELKQASAKQNVTLLNFLLAGLAVWLHRVTAQADVIVGLPAAGQNVPELHAVAGSSDLVGHSVNLLPLRARCRPELAFRDLLRALKQHMLDAFEHQSCTFGTLLEKLARARDGDRPPLVSVIFNYDRIAEPPPVERLGWEVSTVAPAFSLFDLGVNAVESCRGLAIEYRFNPDLFEAATIARWIAQYRTVLAAAAGTPERPLAELPILPAQERERVLSAWNPTSAAPAENRRIDALIDAQVARTPDATAVVHGERRLNYAELAARADQLAAYLRSCDVGPESIVAVAMERSLDLVVALLGVVKAGAAFLPIDPSYPQARIEFMLQDASPRALLTHTRLADQFTIFAPRVICVDAIASEPAAENKPALPRDAGSGALAYVIYTSGSTGRPKAVLVEHPGLSNLVRAQIAGFEIRAGSRLLQFASISFDAAVSEIFTALVAGAELHLPSRDVVTSAAKLTDFLNRHAIDIVTLPPSMLALLAPGELPRLRTVVSAGESCTWDLAERWMQGRRFINAYGPTEATIGPTMHVVETRRLDCATVPIGRPIANMQAYVVDARLQPAPIGVAGELCLGGIGIARGYLHQPELTAEKFVSHAFQPGANARLYRTGDLVRFLADGNLEYLGRIDQQVKVRGFRVEPGEIEAVLRQHAGVQEVAVVARGATPSEQELAAFVVLRPQAHASSSELRAHVRQRLPEFMAPSSIVAVAELPRTPSGKLDRKALATHAIENGAEAAAIVPPRNSVEAGLLEIWKRVLKRDHLGVTDDFFAVGGHSLLAIRLSQEVQQRYGRPLSLASLLEKPTIEQIAENFRES